MSFAKPLGCIVLFSFLSFSLSAQQSPASNPQAIALLQKAWSALSGGQALKDVTLSGTARRIAGADDETGTVVFKATANDSGELALSFPSGARNEVRTITNDGLVGSWTGPDGVAHPVSLHNLITDWGWFPAFTVSGLNSAENSLLMFVAQETRDGQSVLHVTASQQFPSLPGDVASLIQHLSDTDIFLNASTSLPAAITFNTHPDNNAIVDIPIEIRFSGYRLVNGAQIPFHVQKFLNNGLVLDLQFDSAALNTGLTASQFRLQ